MTWLVIELDQLRARILTHVFLVFCRLIVPPLFSDLWPFLGVCQHCEWFCVMIIFFHSAKKLLLLDLFN